MLPAFKKMCAAACTAVLALGLASGAQSKTLVAYFSANEGNTAHVAKAIAKAEHADLFKITPVPAYTEADLDHSDPQSRVCREHDSKELRDKTALSQTVPDNFDEDDTVYIGYPIWWGQAAWPVEAFVKGNDFTGKRIIPFCTSGSSPYGTSGMELHRLNGTGVWIEGDRLSPKAPDDEIADWVKSLY